MWLRGKLNLIAEPVVLVGALEGSFLASFGLGWGVTIGAGLASYPLDTIRRRMMMTSGSGVNYKSMFDAGSQIIAKEGVKSLFKGAGANILRGVAGAGVLSLYDKLQEVMFGKVYSGGTFCLPISFILVAHFYFRIRLNKRLIFSGCHDMAVEMEDGYLYTFITHRLSHLSFSCIGYNAALYPILVEQMEYLICFRWDLLPCVI